MWACSSLLPLWFIPSLTCIWRPYSCTTFALPSLWWATPGLLQQPCMVGSWPCSLRTLSEPPLPLWAACKECIYNHQTLFLLAPPSLTLLTPVWNTGLPQRPVPTLYSPAFPLLPLCKRAFILTEVHSLLRPLQPGRTVRTPRLSPSGSAAFFTLVPPTLLEACSLLHSSS